MAGKLRAFALRHKKELFLLLIILIALIPLYPLEYSTDTYVIHSGGIKAYSKIVFDSARPITALFMLCVGAIWDNIYFLYYVSLTLCAIFTFLAIRLLALALAEYVGKYSYAISALILFNPLSLEYFLFMEKGMFCIAIFLVAAAFKLFTIFCSGSWYALPIGSLLLGLCSLIYQPLCAMLPPLLVTYIFVRYKDVKEWTVKILLAILLYGVGLLFDLFFLLLFAKGDRAGTLHLENLKSTFLFAGVWQSLLIYLAVFLLIYGISYIFAHRVGNFLVLSLWARSVTVLVSALCAVMLPFVLTEPNEVWFPFRIICPIGAALGCCAVVFIKELKGYISAKKVGVAVICIILALELIFFEAMFIGRAINTKADRELCEKIGEKIASYEEKSGVEVKKVSIYYDKSITQRNKGVIKIGDSNVRAFSKSWSDVSSLNAILDKSYIKVKQSKQIKEHFAGQDWQEYTAEQLIFVGDTLHICVY